MELGNVVIDPSFAAAGSALAGFVSAFVWWLVRKRQKRVRLPTIRIMQLESRILPRLLLRLPPLVPFFCFVFAALVLFGFSLKPSTQVFTPFEPNQTRIHLFLDMSASVAAQISLEDYVQRASQLFQSLQGSGRVTVSSSHAMNITEPASSAELAQHTNALGFHRAGLRLGPAFKQLTQNLGDVDRLIIVSDRDQHSWTGFNWNFLIDDMNVIFFDLSGSGPLANTFINDARFLSTPSSPSMDWDVDLSVRRGEGNMEEIVGRLEAFYRNQSLGVFPWVIESNKQKATVRLSWPASSIEGIGKPGEDRTATQLGNGGDSNAVVFRLSVDGSDALALDNEYRAPLLGLRKDVLLISETASERALEDPASQLEIALSVLGFRPKRQDFVLQPGPDVAAFPFWVLIGGAGSGLDRFCPQSIVAARLAMKDSKGSKSAKGAVNANAKQPIDDNGLETLSNALPKVWLAPQTIDANYQELCQCYARLMLTDAQEDVQGDRGEPEYCQHVESRAQWVGLLPSLGAKQIGGQLGDASAALAWQGKDRASGLDILAFTVPLQPMVTTGINHAQFPVLIRELLQWQGVLTSQGNTVRHAWPRIEDISSNEWDSAAARSASSKAEQTRLSLTNVPLGESLLTSLEPQLMPPRWTSQMDWSDKQLPAKKDREDPLPWLKLAAMLAVAVTLLEALWGLGGRFIRFLTHKPREASLLGCYVILGLGLAFLPSSTALAKIEFNLLGYGESGMQLSTLAREVSYRTSIELAIKPKVYSGIRPETLLEPWLWAGSLSTIAEADGRLRRDVAFWIKRGGFLIIEAPLTEAQLNRLTEWLVTEVKVASGDVGWLPLPPDHELMRSFYLLDALPACNGQVWRGFQYDGRLAILAIPYGFLASLMDRRPQVSACGPKSETPDDERSVRIFVNLVMVALATDYKKDQIHLPEILKRLR